MNRIIKTKIDASYNEQFILTILLILYILMNVRLTGRLSAAINNIYSKILLYGLSLYVLVYSNILNGLLMFIAVYVTISNIQNENTLPPQYTSQTDCPIDYSPNQTQYTLEEEVVSTIPNNKNTIHGAATFKPVLTPLNNAKKLT